MELSTRSLPSPLSPAKRTQNVNSASERRAAAARFHQLALQEVLICFSHNAPRAAIVMMWNLTYFHLVHYIITHKLAEFNAAYPVRLGGAHKKAKVPVLSRYDDFSVDLEESEVLAIAKAAGAITHDQWKILDGKLGRRNSAAHPSTVVFLPIHTEEYILDLATNIILALPL